MKIINVRAACRLVRTIGSKRPVQERLDAHESLVAMLGSAYARLRAEQQALRSDRPERSAR